MVTLVLTLAVTVVALAKGADEWKKAEGSYTWKESAQYNNGRLIIKPMEEDLFLFEFATVKAKKKHKSPEITFRALLISTQIYYASTQPYASARCLLKQSRQ